MMSLQPYAYYDSGDYEINNHTRGVSVSFTDQLNPQNLIEAEGTYTTSSGARIYNEQMFAFGHAYGNAFAVLVNRNNPLQRHLLSHRGQRLAHRPHHLFRRPGAAALPTGSCRRS